jgi:hypothetical protein
LHFPKLKKGKSNFSRPKVIQAIHGHPMVGDFEKPRSLPKAKVEYSWEYIEVERMILNSRSIAKKESSNKVIKMSSKYWLIGRSPLMKKKH